MPNLPNAENYTGHSFRRTSATILAENGGDLLTLKQHGGWKSSTVAEGYIAESISGNKRIATMVQGHTSIKESETTSFSGQRTSTFIPTRPSTPLTIPIPQVLPLSDVQYENENIKIPPKKITNTSTGVFNVTYNNCTINYYINDPTKQ